MTQPARYFVLFCQTSYKSAEEARAKDPQNLAAHIARFISGWTATCFGQQSPFFVETNRIDAERGPLSELADLHGRAFKNPQYRYLSELRSPESRRHLERSKYRLD